MDQLPPPLFNPQAADAEARGLLQPTAEDLPSLIAGWSGPRPLRVCSGGTSSRAAAEGQWTLDLRRTMTGITWNAADQTVRIGGGCRMGQVLEQLHPLGRTVSAGLSGWPGVGYVLTGGMGPLSREHGLAVDQLQAIAGVWGSGEPFLLHRDHDQASAEWRGLCGAAPFLAVVREVVLATQPLRPLWIKASTGSPDQLPDWLVAAECSDPSTTLQWSWSADGCLRRLQVSGHEQAGWQRIDGLHQLPPLTPPPSGESRLHGEVVGLLGPAHGEGWRRLLPELRALMHRCPHGGCSLSSQQLGDATAAVPAEATSFVHRDAVWKPWITAVWPAGDAEARQRSLRWLCELWSVLEPLCPGVHLAQLHDHLPFHQRELALAFGPWLPGLRQLKARRDPDGTLPGL